MHGDLSIEVYMKVPWWFNKTNEYFVCKLHKPIYGLYNKPIKFTKELVSNNFQQLKANQSMFFFQQGSKYVITLTYVDDVQLMSNGNRKKNKDKKDQL